MNLKIAVLPGDGIGPEVTEQAVKVLNAIAQNFNHKFELHYADVGAIAIDNHNDPLPESTLDLCKSTDAILFGALLVIQNTIIIHRQKYVQSKGFKTKKRIRAVCKYQTRQGL
jgi:isocitrate/isopropylmalate dehydrogenase